MLYREPSTIEAAKDQIKSSGTNELLVAKAGRLISHGLDFHVPITVSMTSIDDFVLAVEQDYDLKKIVQAKLPAIVADEALFNRACRLVEIYLSVIPYCQKSNDARIARRFATSNLNGL